MFTFEDISIINISHPKEQFKLSRPPSEIRPTDETRMGDHLYYEILKSK